MSITRQINILSRCGNIYRSDKLEGTDLCSTHHSYILTLCRNPGLTQEQLAKRIYVNKSNVTRQINYLEEKGYVQRVQSKEDKRAFLLYPTEKAKNIQPFISDMLKAWRSYITEGISEDELEFFGEILDRISERAKAYVDSKND